MTQYVSERTGALCRRRNPTFEDPITNFASKAGEPDVDSPCCGRGLRRKELSALFDHLGLICRTSTTHALNVGTVPWRAVEGVEGCKNAEVCRNYAG